MKKIFLMIIISTLYSNISYAAQGTVSGTIQKIRSHNLSISDDWVNLSGVTTAGSCKLDGTSPIFILTDDGRGKRHLSILLAAKLANKAVIIAYDDTNVNGAGYCYIRYLDI